MMLMCYGLVSAPNSLGRKGEGEGERSLEISGLWTVEQWITNTAFLLARLQNGPENRNWDFCFAV